MFPIKSCYMGVLLLATSSVLAHCALQPSMPTDPFVDNPAEEKSDDSLAIHKRPSFFVGSRYGRSGAGMSSFLAPSSSKTRRLSVMPRNDRFFLGSRYGKRGEYVSPYEQSAFEASAAAQADEASNKSSATESGAPYMMSCIYTGLRNLYRCNSIEEINNIINQLTAAHNSSDDDK